MDWGLVLASQEIEAMIERTEEGWGLVVEERDYERAQAALQQYRAENSGWRWKQQLPGSGLVFHWGALVWVAAMAGFYYWTMAAFPQLQGAGMMDNRRVAGGEWWRLFTAITLHENLPHLAANAATGFLLLGLAMARYGPGVAMLAAFLAGAAGNGASLAIHSDAKPESWGVGNGDGGAGDAFGSFFLTLAKISSGAGLDGTGRGGGFPDFGVDRVRARLGHRGALGGLCGRGHHGSGIECGAARRVARRLGQCGRRAGAGGAGHFRLAAGAGRRLIPEPGQLAGFPGFHGGRYGSTWLTGSIWQVGEVWQLFRL